MHRTANPPIPNTPAWEAAHTEAKNRAIETEVRWPSPKDFQKPKGHEDWDFLGKVQAGLSLESERRRGRIWRGIGNGGWVSPSWGPAAGNHWFDNEHSMFKETGRRSTRCVASGKRALPFLQNVVSQPWRILVKDPASPHNSPHIWEMNLCQDSPAFTSTTPCFWVPRADSVMPPNPRSLLFCRSPDQTSAQWWLLEQCASAMQQAHMKSCLQLNGAFKLNC